VWRHVYQSCSGGATYVPLERGQRFFCTATPRLAQLLSWKYAHLSGECVVKDLSLNHQLTISKTLVQNVCQSVGSLLSTHESEWQYELPACVKTDEVAFISIGRDGTCMPVLPKGWREAMCGTISLFKADGTRLHTIYQACAPEKGKEVFNYLMDKEIEAIRKKCPHADLIGVADGARDNWQFLEKYVQYPILDFYHASTYLAKVAEVIPDKTSEEKKEWLVKTCHQLKHEKGAAIKIVQQIKELKDKKGIPLSENEQVRTMITYFENNSQRMNYKKYQKLKYPIGSGVTEAACKIIVKQRLAQSGMRWSIVNTDNQLICRTLALTEDRWAQAWMKIGTLN
jgi:hypothetical protein